MKILFVTLSNIGDAVLTTPVMEILHLNYPEAFFTVVASEKSAEVFRKCPYVQDVLTLTKEGGYIQRYLPLISDLRRTNFDIIVDLKTAMLPLFLKGKKKIYSWSDKGSGIENMHKVELHLKSIESLNLNKKSCQTKIWFDESDLIKTDKLITGIGRKVIALGVGARGAGKRWSIERFAKLGRMIEEKIESSFALVGGKGEEELGEEFGKRFGGDFINLIGKLSLSELGAFFSKCSALISNDSGVMHIGAASGIPVVGIFGPSDPVKYAPWGEKCSYIRKVCDIPCPLGARECDYRQKCLEDIKVEEVYNLLKI